MKNCLIPKSISLINCVTHPFWRIISHSKTTKAYDSTNRHPTFRIRPWGTLLFTMSLSRQRSSSISSQVTIESESGESGNLSSPPRRTTTSVDRNPVVAAMITSNTLRNCHQVEDMVSKCVNSPNEKSFMCQTAQKYLMNCKSIWYPCAWAILYQETDSSAVANPHSCAYGSVQPRATSMSREVLYSVGNKSK